MSVINTLNPKYIFNKISRFLRRDILIPVFLSFILVISTLYTSKVLNNTNRELRSLSLRLSETEKNINRWQELNAETTNSVEELQDLRSEFDELSDKLLQVEDAIYTTNRTVESKATCLENKLKKPKSEFSFLDPGC